MILGFFLKKLGHVQNPPSQIREPLTDRGLGVIVIVKNKK